MNFKKVLFGAAAATVAVSGVSFVPFSSAFAADGIPTITAGDSTVPAMDVVDVASYQGNLPVSAYSTMKKYGVKAVIVKVSEGTNYVNPYASRKLRMHKLLVWPWVYITIHVSQTQAVQSQKLTTSLSK